MHKGQDQVNIVEVYPLKIKTIIIIIIIIIIKAVCFAAIKLAFVLTWFL